jgi:uncharacterized protein involved in type VI secretion and phage assembly
MNLGELLGDSGEGGSGQFQGLGVGVVTDNKDPDALGRVRVQLPWHKDGAVSDWAPVATPMAGKDMGTFFLPEIGDEVLVGADQGDASHLYVIGSLWSGRLTPPDTNADGRNNKRFIRTRAGHELMFVDDQSAPLAELSLKDGKKISLSKDGIEITDGTNKIVIDSKGSSMTIQSTADLKIKSNKIAIEATASLELKSSGTLVVKGTLVQIN